MPRTSNLEPLHPIEKGMFACRGRESSSTHHLQLRIGVAEHEHAPMEHTAFRHHRDVFGIESLWPEPVAFPRY
jgi:hypothetical protein